MAVKILPAIACNLDADILSASLPLLETDQVEALEWSFDALWQHKTIPLWFEELLQSFSRAGRLIGHGIYFSLFSGRLLPEQQNWLKALEAYARQYRFDQVTEHFGFMTGTDFHKGAPISVPYTQATLAIGRDRLKRIQQAAQCPVGLENLALAYSPEEAKRHGDFLHELVEPVNGFIILDLHNLYCQLHNFQQDLSGLLQAYPLERVREIHISGGSWVPSATRSQQYIRRDTHDDAVPEEVFALLFRLIPLCPNLRYVVLEQLGAGLRSPEAQTRFRADYERMKAIISLTQADTHQPFNDFQAPVYTLDSSVPEDEFLYATQQILSYILERAPDQAIAMEQLQHTALRDSIWQIEQWQPDMLETAIQIARKWK